MLRNDWALRPGGIGESSSHPLTPPAPTGCASTLYVLAPLQDDETLTYFWELLARVSV